MKYKYLQKVEGYAENCRKSNLLANKAGFLRRERISPKVFEDYCKNNADEAALIDAVFEDEALNADTKKLSATVLNMYMKSIFKSNGEADADSVLYVSEHGEEDLI